MQRRRSPRSPGQKGPGNKERLVIGGLIVLVLAMGLTACEPPRPVVSVWGDSLTYESEADLRFQLGGDYEVSVTAWGGAALCDVVEDIIADAELVHPDLVVVQFSGNAFTACTRPEGAEPTTATILSRYRADALRLLERLQPLGVPVVFVGSPPFPLSVPFADTVDSVYAEIAAGSGGWATYLEAGWAVAAPDGGWTATLPCMSFEDGARGCVDGRIAVRAADSVHLCPGVMVSGTGPSACSVWSSGSWRYAARITGYIRFAVTGVPFGSLDLVAAGPGRVRAAGWAYDPQAGRAPVAVHVYVDHVGVAVAADRSRPDVDAVYPFAGDAHGFDAFLTASPGTHTVCAYAIDVGGSDNVTLGCRTVTVASGSPFGFLDVVRGGAGTVSAWGWAIDPDTPDPIAVHLYVDGVVHALRADVLRPDVGAAYPGDGPIHGFAGTVAATPGPHTVCAYGIDVGPGENSLLGCTSVVVGPVSTTVTTTTAVP